MTNASTEDIRQAVRDTYGRVARGAGKRKIVVGCCNPEDSASEEAASCCGPADGAYETSPNEYADQKSKNLGYSEEELGSVPEGANLGVGCGNPAAIAAIKPGEVVLDLGSGAGFDAFLSARQVGDTGSVIGVDMTPDMLTKARANAVTGGYHNVEFRLGEIEHLPVLDDTVDAIISNCVINLSPEKDLVFKEAYRVLKPGGRLAIKDIVATAELPQEIKNDLELQAGCMAGAETIQNIEKILSDLGFRDISIGGAEETRDLITKWTSDSDVQDHLLSASIEAVKPA